MWIWIALLVVVVAGACVWVLRRSSGKGKMVSMVLLLREPRQYTAQDVRRAATKAFGVRIGSSTDEENFVVQHTPEVMPVLINGLQMGFICSKDRYSDTPDGRGIDPRIVRAMDEHQAWISLDAADSLPRNLKPVAYQHIGKLLAEFVDDNVVGVFSTETSRFMWATPELKAKLRSEDPLCAVKMEDAPMVMIQHDDPKLLATVDEAQRRWPEFVRAYGARKPGEMFAVKLKFTDGDEVEFMWVQVASLDGDTFTGKLDNRPAMVGNVREGSTVTANAADVVDWIYHENGEMRGGFSIKVLAGQA